MKRARVVLIAILVLVQSGCGMKKMATHVMGGISTDGMVAVEGEADVAFARESLPALIKTLEVLRYGNPRDSRALALLSKAYGTYTFGFLEEDLLKLPDGKARQEAAQRASLFYERGKDFGKAALCRRGALCRAFDAPFPAFQREVGKLGKKDVPALFWTAFNWAGWINLHRDDPAAVVDVPRVQALVDRVLSLEPGFYAGSAHVLRGVLAVTRPKMLGGDPELAEAEFGKAQEAAPDYLMTKVLHAQYVARQANDPQQFKKDLDMVLEADAAKMPSQRLANELAKRRAKILLEMQKSLF